MNTQLATFQFNGKPLRRAAYVANPCRMLEAAKLVTQLQLLELMGGES